MHTVNSNIQQNKQHTSYSDQLKPLDYAGNLFFFFFSWYWVFSHLWIQSWLEPGIGGIVKKKRKRRGKKCVCIYKKNLLRGASQTSVCTGFRYRSRLVFCPIWTSSITVNHKSMCIFIDYLCPHHYIPFFLLHCCIDFFCPNHSIDFFHPCYISYASLSPLFD